MLDLLEIVVAESREAAATSSGEATDDLLASAAILEEIAGETQETPDSSTRRAAPGSARRDTISEGSGLLRRRAESTCPGRRRWALP
jgi:hypothetical protein